ncbi:MAG: non-heme iron oxygenase ferredoxin subunit [Dehalococcoidia bacterium]
MAAGTFVKAAKTGDVAPGEVFVIDIDKRQIAICNVDGRFYAIEDVCTHDGSSFDETQLDGEEIMCPRHGAVFNVTDGSVVSMPAVTPVKTYPVRVVGDMIEIEV